MIMETPNLQSAHSTSNTLKKHLEDETFLRALNMLEKAQKNLLNEIKYEERDEYLRY